MIEKLIEQLKKSDRKAQKEFYFKYAAQMFRLVYRYVNNEHDAGSIVNYGFFKIFTGINKFIYQDESRFMAWIKRIMINESLIFLRKKVTYSNLTDNLSHDSSYDNIPDVNLILEDYYNLLRELPDKLRTVINLYAIDGYSHKEIASLLNIKETSSRVYLFRAREFLQKRLTKCLNKNEAK